MSVQCVTTKACEDTCSDDPSATKIVCSHCLHKAAASGNSAFGDAETDEHFNIYQQGTWAEILG